MTTVSQSLSGKTARDENFPVASRLIDKRRRPIILAFYRFVRAADDVADNPDFRQTKSLCCWIISPMRCAGRPRSRGRAAASAFRTHGIAPRHALDLLDAFRRDAVKNRYANIDELMDYCRLSAMPVGRFVLDAHGESRSLWPASDALCAALQVINHLQDCGEDYRRLDRVYLPQSILDAHGATVEMLSERRAPPQLLGAIAELRDTPRPWSSRAASSSRGSPTSGCRSKLQRSTASRASLADRLQHRDPLSQSVHLGKFEFAGIGGLAVARMLARSLCPA